MLTIRPINEEDIAALAEVFVRVYESFDVGERWSKESAQTLLGYWLKKQSDLAFLAEIDGRIVGGFLSGIKPWWDGNHLFDGEIFVHPEFQKQKVGAALLKKVFQEAAEKYDAKTFDAFTFNGSDHPLTWYKKMGFREIKEWTMITGDINDALEKLNY